MHPSSPQGIYVGAVTCIITSFWTFEDGQHWVKGHVASWTKVLLIFSVNGVTFVHHEKLYVNWG
jgi:hypothetical protein